MHRVADLVRAVIDYRIFAILLLNDRTNELRMRFQIGHTPEIERMRIKLGRGIVGQAALRTQSDPRQRRRHVENYINANPDVVSELAVPLIVKNKVIGVIDIQSEHAGLLHPRAPAAAGADRLAHGHRHRKRAALHPRLAAGADPDRAATRSRARSPPSSMSTTCWSASAT